MSPVILVLLAARAGILESLCDAFHRALYDHLNCDVADPLDVSGYQYDRARQRVLRALRRLDEDEYNSFIRSYYDALADVEPAFFHELRTGFSCAQELLELSQQIDPAKADQIVSANFSDRDYAAIAAHALGHFRSEKFLLAPFACWAKAPCRPIGELSACLTKIGRLVLRCEGMSAESIVAYFGDSGIELSHECVRAAALCDPSLILSGPESDRIEPAPGRFTRLDLCAHNVARDAYLTVKTIYGPTDTSEPEVRLTAPPIFISRPTEQFRISADDSALAHLDNRTIGLKLLQRSFLGEGQVQGMGASLHAEVVRLLGQKKRAMSQGELERQIGFPIPLTPESLPPGRIMAYAPGDRFLRADHAHYVLKDWVETDTEKRDRILRARVVTPFTEKSVAFSDELLFHTVHADLLYGRFRIAVSSAIAVELAARLPDRPTELYFLNVLQKQIESRLARTMLPIGKSAYVPTDHAVEREEGETMDSWRKRILARILGCEVNGLYEGVTKLETPISERLRQILQ